jgi:hypothetical protein
MIQTNAAYFDSSRLTLKTLLLHTGNEYPSGPAAYAVHMKISYDNIHHLVTYIQYDKCFWHICADLKVIALTSGLYEVLLLPLRMG